MQASCEQTPPPSRTSAEVDDFMRSVGDIHVDTERYALGVRAVDWCLRGARRSEGGCLFIGGRSGLGKSWLLKRTLSGLEVGEGVSPLVDPLPVVRVSTPSPGAPKAFVARLVEAVVGRPVSTVGVSEAGLFDRFMKLARDRGVKVVVVEEFQHIVDGFETRTNGRNFLKEKVFSELLKGAINDSPIQWIVVGEPPILKFFTNWEQLEGRGRQLPITPFSWPDDREEYSAFLGGYDAALAPLLGGETGLADMVPRFQLATGGLYAQAVRRILKDSAESSFIAGHRSLKDTLAVTYGRWRWVPDADNPFLMPLQEVLVRLDRTARNPTPAMPVPAGVLAPHPPLSSVYPK